MPMHMFHDALVSFAERRVIYMKKKFVAILLATMMISTTIIGCGEKKAAEIDNKTVETITETSDHDEIKKYIKNADERVNSASNDVKKAEKKTEETSKSEESNKAESKKEDAKKNDTKKDISKQENTVQNDFKKNDSKSDSKKKETSNKTNPSTSNKKQETAKPSASAPTPTKPATNSGSNKENSNKAESVHQHNYVAQTHVVHHEATGHNEQYVEQEAWDEQVTTYEDYAWDCCNVCGADITNNVIEHEKAHALAYEGGGHHIEYGTRPVTTTVHHEAVYGTRWVQDSAAYDETVVDGYVCSCGARK